ncbi:MAG TPA: hypothetical protein VGE52_08560 [Pirellulales bacterium]
MRHHLAHLGRLPKELQCTLQTPILRTVQRDGPAEEDCRMLTWPQLQPEGRRERRTLVFLD